MPEITTRYIDHGDEGAVIVRHQIVGPALDAVKELHNTGMHGSRETKHVASVEGVVIEGYCNKRGITLAQFLRDRSIQREFLNDPAHAAWRIWPGRI